MIVPKYGTFQSACQALPGGESQAGALGPFPDLGNPLSDAEIRRAIRVATSDADICLEEVECWRGYARADFVCLTAGVVSIIEIKSDRDSLHRLSEQARVYSSIGERVTLVVGWNLAVRALRAAPNWWDVVLAEREGRSEVRLIQIRDGGPNPGSNMRGMPAMPPVAEVRRLAGALGVVSPGARADVVRRLAASHVPEQDVRDATARWLGEVATRRASAPSRVRTDHRSDLSRLPRSTIDAEYQ